MKGRCPRGFICADWTTVVLAVGLGAALLGAAVWLQKNTGSLQEASERPSEPQIIVVQAPLQHTQTRLRPDIYPEPVNRLALPSGLMPTGTRGYPTPYQQVGVLTAEGGSASSAAPDRTILPLYGRELDARRGRWNYYTRTDGVNPVQVPVRVRNRVCDEDTNGCDELSDGDDVHVPVLGRAFKATVYRRSIFG